MGAGGRADAAFQHGAAIQADAGQLRHGGHLLRRNQAAGLGDLDGIHIGAAGAGQAEGIDRAVQRFVGHDGDVETGGQAAQRGRVVGAYRLFDQVHAAVLQRGDAAHGIEFAPGLVDVDPHAGARRPGRA